MRLIGRISACAFWIEEPHSIVQSCSCCKTFLLPKSGDHIMSFDISMLLRGDEQHWDLAFKWLWPSAIAKAKYSGMLNCCGGDVEDVASQSIEILMKKVEEGVVVQIEDMKALLGRITHDKAVDYCRKLLAKKRGGGMVTSIDQDNGSYDSPIDDSPLGRLEIKELAELIRKTGQQLGSTDWGILDDFFLKEKSYKEIATIHSIAIGSVGTKISRAIDKVRDIMKPYMK